MAPPTARTTVFITVDTEEDNWADYACRSPAVTNISRLPELQALCDRYGAIPTYLVNRPVVVQESSRDILRELHSHGRCEIGMHIHPWNTPPVTEQVGPRNSMLSNLPESLIRAKLSALHATIAEGLGLEPAVFRAGRFGFNGTVAACLVELGYRIDTSVTPLVDWTAEDGPDYRNAPSLAYRFHPERPLQPAVAGVMAEIPPTIGFLRGNPCWGLWIRLWAGRPVPRRLRMLGIMDRLGLAALRWLSPELTSARDMIRLAQVQVRSGAPYLHVMFHSPTLVPGLTPFVVTEAERETFVRRLEEFLDYARASGFQFRPLGAGPEAIGL